MDSEINFTEKDFLTKPDSVSDEDWALYMTGIAVSLSGVPTSIKVYEGYERVRNIIEQKQQISIKARRKGRDYIIPETCRFCGKEAYKTDGRGFLICENMAATNKCEGHNPPKYIKQLQQRNDLCSCGSGKKFKKCCINKIIDDN